MINTFYGDNIFATSEQMLKHEIDNLNALSESFKIEAFDEGIFPSGSLKGLVNISSGIMKIWGAFKRWIKEIWNKIISLAKKIRNGFNKSKLSKNLSSATSRADVTVYILDTLWVHDDFSEFIISPMNYIKEKITAIINSNASDEDKKEALSDFSDDLYGDIYNEALRYDAAASKYEPDYKFGRIFFDEKNSYYTKQYISDEDLKDPKAAADRLSRSFKALNVNEIEKVKNSIDDFIKKIDNRYDEFGYESLRQIITTLQVMTQASKSTIILSSHSYWVQVGADVSTSD